MTVEFKKNGKISYEEDKFENIDVYVNGKLYGELTHENSFEWYLLEYVNGQLDDISNAIMYYYDLKDTESEIKFEFENN